MLLKNVTFSGICDKSAAKDHVL
ncbi:hypothetical protein Golob_006320 [Gossypium lobatum]|uniref:Uncharacterized protein n=1 Tax=Gossypium lobatum TaxID=34289 RepID=A0A7J8MVX6_9ROSI|nr:hypothetical protein [Gossypium lobatum]